MRRTLSNIAAACLILLALAGACTHAQSFDLDRDRQPVAALNGLWRFHPGDDPRWASPTFDDSQWPLLRSDRDWSLQGYPGLSGVAWYRFRVVIKANSPPLSFYFRRLVTSYEVYADGVRIGGYGAMPPHAAAMGPMPTVIDLPHSANAQTITIAIRVWHWPVWAGYYGGGVSLPPLLGAASLIQQRTRLTIFTMSWTFVNQIVLAILEGLAGLAALGFFYLRPREREYLWFGLMLLASTAARCFAIWSSGHPFGVLQRDDVISILAGLTTLAAIAFYARFLHGKRGWLYWLAVGCTLASMLVCFADGYLLSVQQTQEFEVDLALPASAYILLLLYRGAVSGIADARLLLFPVLLQQLAVLAGEVVWLSYLGGWQHVYATQDITLSSWPFAFTLSDSTAALFLLAMLVILIGRFTRTRREEERFAAELDAARSVQHILIPDEIASIPGLTIAGVYKPASEVGGDFYQIIPLSEINAGREGALIIVGDVSGKGLQAAMTVSLIVGTLRTLADHTQQPARILAGLNRRLIGRSGGGFTTCLVMLIEADGAVRIGTAGHLPPYLNGKELALDDGLPLGLTLDAVYTESSFQFAPGDILTLISDGVLEARNQAGELFGFDRTRALSTQEASYIASAAQDFGQEDDITVLTLRRTADAPRPAKQGLTELVL